MSFFYQTIFLRENTKWFKKAEVHVWSTRGWYEVCLMGTVANNNSGDALFRIIIQKYNYIWISFLHGALFWNSALNITFSFAEKERFDSGKCPKLCIYDIILYVYVWFWLDERHLKKINITCWIIRTHPITWWDVTTGDIA